MEISQFKENVKAASAYLERAGINVPHTQLLEAISKAFGERNWSTMRAMLENPPVVTSQAETGLEVGEWSPSTGPMPENYFIRQGANLCPVCGGKHINSDAPEADGEDAWDETECETCGSSWRTDYRITGYSQLQIGADTPTGGEPVGEVRDDVVNDIVEDVKERARKFQFAVYFKEDAEHLVQESVALLNLDATELELSAAVNRLVSD